MRALDRVTWTPALRVASACVALALVADVALLVRAGRAPTNEVIVPLRIAAAPAIVARTADPKGLIESAASREPFEPLDSGEQAASAATVVLQSAPVPVARPRLVGTMAGGAESFVVMALVDGSMKVVHVGERAGELKLRAVTAGGAVFEDNDGARVTLRAPTPGSEPQQP